MSGIIGRFNFRAAETLNIQKKVEVNEQEETTNEETNSVKAEEFTTSTENIDNSLNMLAMQNQINLQVDLSKTKLVSKTTTVAVDESDESIDTSEEANSAEEAEKTDDNAESDVVPDGASSGPKKSFGSWLRNWWHSLWHPKGHVASEDYVNLKLKDISDGGLPYGNSAESLPISLSAHWGF